MLVLELTLTRPNGDIYYQGFYQDDLWNPVCTDIKFATKLDKCSADVLMTNTDIPLINSYSKRLIEVG